jgi:hypothetical protein
MDKSNLINQVLLTFTDKFKKHRKDISAVRLTPDKHLWLGSDETSTIERLSFVDAQNFAKHKQFHVTDFITLPASEEEEIDIEGLAYDNYYLWLMGSHSYKRKKPKDKHSDEENIQRLAEITSEPNRYIIGRIPLVDGELLPSCPHPKNPDVELSAAKLEVTPQGNLLMEALADDPHLGFFVKATIPGKDNGFDLEGLAVYQNRVFLGLRGPVLRGWAIILEIEFEISSSGLMRLKEIPDNKKRYKKHFIFLNGLGIRDLLLDAEDFLILAGPTMDLDGPVQVYRLKNGVHLPEDVLKHPEIVLNIPYGIGEDHAEGMILFQEIIGVPSLLTLYDSPAKNRLIEDTGVLADVFQLNS